ncbi:leucine-rich repeat and guanylate kinase domain-containing protein isoform X2 [Erinaceus europaeus]|uniref:Leucine-rich repeat and guanylate kinase domain-containing protein isoform X2 n=1 Tax=Erinaceus europaeus TaxID=9365 RepID=A0ABM3XUT5_ERIEU|nr:leucine-rich repeat and guanylate kinase domain-containing protein isoform X2 [Erinaceus europaeus]
MATSGSHPERLVPSSLPTDSSSLRFVAQSKLLNLEKSLMAPGTSFPMGQNLRGAFHRSSSFLLQQLVHQELGEDTEEYEEEDFEDLGEEEEESSESSESEMVNLEEHSDGILREEAVAEALHQLGRSGSGTEQVYLNLTLSGCELIDISILCGYIHLQKLDLSVNNIEDLSCVGNMPYLLELNASHNKLTTFFNFKPPKNLRKVDFSYNQISEMSDLSAYQALTKLILDCNQIKEITGLEQCNNLTHLSLAQNKITEINGLYTLPIKILCLSNNQIEKITGLEELRVLQNVDLSHNQISSLQGLENHDLLEIINLEDNKISELSEIEYIEQLPLLRVLNLLKNPLQEKPEYWQFVIFMLLRLTELDQKKIKVEDKVSAVNKYDPPPEVVATQDHLTHVVNSVMQPQRIFDRPCHTTRPPYFGEGDRVDYHFISQEVFDEMLSMGKFILTFNYGNHNYGLSRDTVEGIARDGLASCIHMEIEGMRSLKYSYFEPRYILVVPMNKKKYEGHLRRKGLFSRSEIEFAVSRVDHYIKVNQEMPGYFDAVINADDLDAAYHNLSQLVREYLGLTEETSKTLAPTTAGAPSNKKSPTGVPAHLVPSPRRLAKLQADGQITEHLTGKQTHASAPENQDTAPSQNELSPNSQAKAEPPPPPPPPPQPNSTAPGTSQQTQDTAPNQKEENVQPSEPASITATTGLPESEAQTAAAPSPGPPQEPDQDEESGEAKVSPTGSTSLDLQKTQGDANDGPSQPDGTKTLGTSVEASEEPLEEGTPKVEAVRADTPYPELPHPQDSTSVKQSQDRGDTATLLPKSRMAPTRLPQPRVLAPLQSPRPTPKLLSPSREDAQGTSSDQTMTPSPRPLLAPEGDSSKLPPISPSQSKPPQNQSPQTGPSPPQPQEETVKEVKLPLISPPVQEQAPEPTPVEEAQVVRLPRIPTPFTEPPQPQNTGAHPTKGRPAPKAGQFSSKKTPDHETSPQNQDLGKPTGARKKKLPIQSETAKGTERLSKRKPLHVPGPPHPSPPQSPQGNQKENALSPEIPKPTHTKPLPSDSQLQEEKKGRAHSLPKKAQTKLPPSGRSQKAAVFQKVPPLKSKNSGGFSQESSKAAPRNEQQRQEGPPQPSGPLQSEEASTGTSAEGSTLVDNPKRKDQIHRKRRSHKRDTTSEPPKQECEPSTSQPVSQTQAQQESSQARESSAPRDHVSRQQTKEKGNRKHGGTPQDQSPAAPQDQVSAEEQGSRKGRLRARGSQSTKI